MQFIKGKLAWLSVLLLGVGYVAAPPVGVAQNGGHESHSMQAAPNRGQPNNFGRAEGNRQPNNAGRWNNGRSGNNFSERDRDHDRDRNRDRDRHNRDRGFYGSGAYSYGYNQGFYYGAAPYGYYNSGNAYDTGYADGFNAGRFDRLQGNLYNPRQYELSGDPDYFSGFVAGYEDGYKR